MQYNMDLHEQLPPLTGGSWFERAMPGIAYFLVDAVWPGEFWWTALRFGVFLTGRTVYGLFCIYYDDGWTVHAARQYIDALFVVSGYVATHLLHKTLRCLIASGRYLLGFVWAYSLWMCTACGVLAGIMFLMRLQGIKASNVGWSLVNQVLSLASGMIILHFRFSVFCRKLWAFIKKSSGIQICRLCLKYSALRILGRPTFYELETFDYPSILSQRRQIRLLHLIRQNPIMDIQAKLMCYSLDNAPPYEAISYVWGKNPQKEHHVILDGRKFCVSTNVYQILRRRGSLFSSKLIWIDSICINQSDNVEKREQVRMMRDIFHRASHVSVCLGENPDAWLAWRMIKQLVYFKAFLTGEGLTNQLFILMSMKDTIEWIGSQLTAFLDLIDHPWFNRAWVVQEIVVARSVNILYGNEELPWHQFMQVLDILFCPSIKGIGPLFQHTGEDGVTRPVPSGPTHAAFMHGYRIMLAGRQTCALHDTLRLFQAFESTEPRDKIFALFGLTESAAELSHIIDYDKPLSGILVEVANNILERGHLLNVLQFAGIGWDKARTDIPSWVVDWSIRRDPVTLAHSFVDDQLQYRAAIQRASEISHGSNKGHIRVRGQFIDRIQEMGLIMEGPNLNERNRPLDSVDEAIAWFDEAEDLVNKNLTAPYHNGQELSQVVWRTCIGDRIAEARPAPAACEASIHKYKQVIYAAKDLASGKLKELPSELNPLFSHFQKGDGMEDGMADILEFTWLCGIPSFPRKLAVTSEGYIAMVPRWTKSGDIICAIWGAQVPFVLRLKDCRTIDGGDKTYQLVGECYVHGMMDGECFNLPVEDEIFEIV